MKEIKAFIHRNRISDVVHALKEAGYRHISVVDVLGMLKAMDSQEQQYSVELGSRVTPEIKLELVCEDHEVKAVVSLITDNAHTGQNTAGWLYVSNIEQVIKIDGV